MRRIILGLTVLFLCACSQEDGYTIKGTAQGFDDGIEIYLQELGSNNKMIALDTAIVAAERFQFEKPLQGKNKLNILSTSENNGRLLLIQDGKPLTVTLYRDSIASSLLQGSAENELFYTYVKGNRLRNAEKANLARALKQAQAETDGVMVEQHAAAIKKIDLDFISEKKALIDSNNGSMVAIMALSDLINAKVLKVEETERYFKGLASDVQGSSVGKSIKNYIAKQKSQNIASGLASVGNKAPEFSAQTPDGTDLALADTLGKYTIIDFWASWCRPCRAENPNVVRVYNKYHDKGLNIISVSLDRQGQDARWKQAIEKDQMDWYHVSNLQYWQDPIARAYGVRSIPATFLLDENGVIIAKNLRGSALQAKMDELLGGTL
jgi:peroxiredoxin